MNDIDKESNIYNGAVALVDILGYKEMLCEPIEYVKDNIIDRLIETIETANSITNRERHRFNRVSNNDEEYSTKIKYMFYSDSFILYIESDNNCKINSIENTLDSLCYALCIILDISFRNNIALRGAVSYGEFYLKKCPFIMIGKVFTELSELEKSQKWAGIVLSEELEKFNYSNQFTVTYATPLKCKDGDREMKVLNWVFFKANYITTTDKSIDFERCFDSDREDVRIKKENTINFYNKMKGLNAYTI
jgi:hypothetical protein